VSNTDIYGWILLVHLLYDFHWQGDFVGTMKAKYDFILWVHSATWSLLIILVFYYHGIVLTGGMVAWLILSHMAIDRWKARSPNDESKLTWRLWVDQGLHLVSIVLLFVWIRGAA
jgi:hypothetical protein